MTTTEGILMPWWARAVAWMWDRPVMLHGALYTAGLVVTLFGSIGQYLTPAL